MTFFRTTWFHSLAIFSAGLFVSQFISFIHVYLSNMAYHDALSAIAHAGYLAVPNTMAATELKTFSAAFNGGLFFTLTTGLCSIVLTFLFAWLWHRLPLNKIAAVSVPLIIWLFCLSNTLLDGLSSLLFFQFLLIPPVVFVLSMMMFTRVRRTSMSPNPSLHIITFAVCAVIGATAMDTSVFLGIRDSLLLGNPVGRWFNAYYYKNSLYASRVVKSPAQRLLKTCAVRFKSNADLEKKAIQRLLACDYIPLKDDIPTDLYLNQDNDNLEFRYREDVIVTIPAAAAPRLFEEAVRRFEKATDCHGFFRMFTLFSMLFIGMLGLFLVLYLPIRTVITRFADSKRSGLFAAAICMGCFWVVFSFWGTQEEIKQSDLPARLSSSNARDRINALKSIYRQQLDMNFLPFYPDISKVKAISERYWFAKNLRYRGPRVRDVLSELLNDSHFNVVCMAFYSLGFVGDQRDVGLILEKMKHSDNWYEQWYAYKALRRLGWTQRRLE